VHFWLTDNIQEAGWIGLDWTAGGVPAAGDKSGAAYSTYQRTCSYGNTMQDIADNAKGTTDLWRYGNTTFINGGQIYTNSVTANQIAVSVLSALTANLGTVTAGSLIGLLIKSSNGSARIELNGDKLVSYASNGSFNTDVATLESGKLVVGKAGTTSNVTVESDSISFGNGGKIDVDSLGWHIVNTLDNIYFGSLVSGGQTMLHGEFLLEGELVTNKSETGQCGLGGPPNGVSGVVLLETVNFRTKKTYVPSSISYTTITGNRAPKFTDITVDGFSIYIEGEGSTGAFIHWRGKYTA
jgi:hypothetical protein